MMRNHNHGWRAAFACATVLAGVSSPATAVQFNDGPITGSIDTTLSFGVSSRLQGRDDDLICTANGGTGYSCNVDDGNLNYETGTVSQVMKITSDIELNHKSGDYGAFIRIKGFTDHYNNDADDTERTPLSGKALDLVGENFDVLDAYGWLRFDLAGRPAEVRLGKHVLNWGESTFIQGGINAINPIDVAAIRLPGAELREALLPVNMLSMSWAATNNLSIEGFYQLDWDETSPDPSGSLFSTNDFATDGGYKVVTGWGDIPDTGFSFDAVVGAGFTAGVLNPVLAAFAQPTQAMFDPDFLSIYRSDTDDPQDHGQWGLALRYFSQALNDTEFGLYYLNYHSRLPLISARTGTAAGVGNAIGAALLPLPASIVGPIAVDRYVKTASYFTEYPEDIDMIGASFNTSLGQWAVQGEYSFKDGVPLQIDDVEILFAALTPIALIKPAYAVNQLGVYGTDQYVRGYIRRDVSQLQVTGTRLFSNVMGADQLALVAEAAVTHVHNMPSKNRLRLNGPGTFTSGDPYHATITGGHAGKVAEDADDFADATSWGFRVAARWTYNNAIQSVNLMPRVAYQHDVDGVSPGPGGNFIEGRQALTLGLAASYKQQWSADIALTSFFGAGRHNLMNDRDFISFNLKYSF